MSLLLKYDFGGRRYWKVNASILLRELNLFFLNVEKKKTWMIQRQPTDLYTYI